MKTRLSVFLSISILLIGIIITVGVYFVQTNIIQTYDKNLPYISLGDNIKNKTTKGHLWFEELMAGDASIDFEKDVLRLLENSDQILKGALKGELTELGKFEKDKSQEVTRLIKQAEEKLEDFMERSKKRYEFKKERDRKIQLTNAKQDSVAHNEEQAGGELDQQFDAAYENLQKILDDVVNFTNKKVSNDIQFINIIAWATIICLMLIFVILAIVIYNIQSKNEQTIEKDTLRLEKESRRLTKMTTLVSQISKGNHQAIQLDTDLEKDDLAQSLIEMQTQLNIAKKEDMQRNWANEGYANLGDVLRTDTENIKDWYFNIIFFVVNYLKFNQGAIYIIEDNKTFEEGKSITLKASLAYERRKYLQKHIALSEGLLGRCVIEKQPMYLSNIPQNYLQISSGLGAAKPEYLSLIPLKNNDEVLGVLEIAAFNELEPFQKTFLENISTNIANSLISVKNNEMTKTLLQQTQEQAEQLRAAEEEMRQNMEELATTQEEMQRRELEYLNEIKELKENLN